MERASHHNRLTDEELIDLHIQEIANQDIETDSTNPIGMLLPA